MLRHSPKLLPFHHLRTMNPFNVSTAPSKAFSLKSLLPSHLRDSLLPAKSRRRLLLVNQINRSPLNLLPNQTSTNCSLVPPFGLYEKIMVSPLVATASTLFPRLEAQCLMPEFSPELTMNVAALRSMQPPQSRGSKKKKQSL